MWSVYIVDVKNNIGKVTSGNMNVKNVVFVPPYGAERLCMAQTAIPVLVYRNAPVDINQEEFFS